MEFERQVVMVTGAGSGIGRATALMFAVEGAFVAVCDINAEHVASVINEMEETSKARALPIVLDVSDSVAIKKAVEQIIGVYGKIDVLVNVAGIISLGIIETITDESWDRVLDINLKGTFMCSRAVVPLMKDKRAGCIINVTAAAAKTGGMNVGANYVASKGGLNSFTIHLAKQLAPFNIRVNAVSPGPIETPMLTHNQSPEMRNNITKATPLGMGYPQDIAYGILFLASKVRARYITGEILDVDGGLFMD